MATNSEPNRYEIFSLRVTPLLKQVYGEAIASSLAERLYAIVEPHMSASFDEDRDKWSQEKTLLITYGNSLKSSSQEPPLRTLDRFLNSYLQDTITGVHILPFCPYSSDDGFAVIDYLAIDPALGTWDDIDHLSQNFNLMVDLVINHVSSQHEWFEQFKRGEQPGCDYFIEVDPETDLSAVVRPRSSPLLAEVDTVNGKKYVWATFSHDQIDLNFANPDVLVEMVKVMLAYINAGAKYIRLDAIGYLWKTIGTSCIHRPETHALIKVFRQIVQMVNSSVALITETNVPNRENLSYFGNRNEAHMIYNFSLPPLLLNALLQGRSDHLRTWMMSMPPSPVGCAYLNFTASHDGIGMRPTEGLLTSDEYETLLECMQQFGGRISLRRHADGTESPYEINISLFDAFKGTVKGEDEWQIERFICSQTIAMAVEGIPAFYIHSLLATPNHADGVVETGQNRTINRHQWNYETLEALISDPKSPQAIVLKELSRRIQIRRRQPAFHPNATQYTLQLRPAIFGFWRQSMTREQSIFSIHNLTDEPQTLRLSDLNLVCTDDWFDLIGGTTISEIYEALDLAPYQSMWLSNRLH
ncbi:MAG: alpha-amylase [Oscillatoriales cyanobacterium]|nr:MAG: alpha-amylase [Oscillatoriales cyanobacterium]